MKIAATFSLFLGATALSAQELPQLEFRAPFAPPPAPPIVVNESGSLPSLKALAAGTYSIGDPTAEEQLYVELINRARANPQAEAALLAGTLDEQILGEYNVWDVDLPLMISQFSIYAPAQPLAINAKLTVAARRQTADMLNNAFQEHTGSDGSTPTTRIQAAGYNFFTIGENIYANAESVAHGHAGFEVDWGPGLGGMQTPPGHRESIHRAVFREVGVGVLLGNNEKNGRSVGPQLVTQNFGTAQSSAPFITGVVYYDLNGNQFYDVGEGIGGVTVEVSGTATKGVSALSGGYAVPVSGNGNVSVTFSGAGFSSTTRSATVANQENEKVDFIPAYAPPVVSGSSTPAVGRANAYAISAVGGATAYEWRSFAQAAARAEGAETGTANITIDQTSGYDVIQTQIKTAGSSAFHFAHPEGGARPQSVTLKPTYLIESNSSLSFQSRLGWAGPVQVARVQISTDGGATWQNLYSQAGSGDRGETAFTRRQVDLASYAGTQARIRFVYDISSGGFFPQTDPEVGWYLDDIQFSNVDEVANEQVRVAANGSFDFNPVTAGTYVLQARAKTGHDFLPWGPSREVQAAVNNTPEFRVSRVVRSGPEIHINVELLAGAAGSFTLESKASLSGAWAAQTATLETQSPTQFLIKVARAVDPQRFFRVRAQ